MHKPRKRFGQHFLKDTRIIETMIHAIAPQYHDNFIEIGPGLGALTIPLSQYLASMRAIEIDRDICAHWKRHPLPNVEILSANALDLPYDAFGDRIRIVGNLPYNIGTALLLQCTQYYNHIKDIHVMLQKEVSERLYAQPGTKSFGRLSILMQYHYAIMPICTVSPEAFDPPPKVDSEVVRLVPYQHSPYPKVDMTVLENITALAFSTRRKTVKNAIQSILSQEEIVSHGIDPTARPETLGIDAYIRLANYVFLKGE